MTKPLAAVVAALVSIAGGCSAGYTAGSFLGPRGEFEGARATSGCLDVAVDSVRDPAAAGATARLTFGNRCSARVRIDIPSIRATGRGPGGSVVPMTVFDPRGEIRTGALDVGGVGSEVLEWLPEGSMSAVFPGHEEPETARVVAGLSELCLDLTRLDPDDPSPRPLVTCVAIDPT